MLIIFTGEDIAQSRRLFAEERQKYTKAGYEIQLLTVENLNELDKWLYDSTGLFSLKKVFVGENILGKRENRKLLTKYDTESHQVNFLIWEEDTDEKVLKSNFKNAVIKISRLPYNIFKFLDSILPENKKNALELLSKISSDIEENIILYMVVKRVRELLLVKLGCQMEKKLMDWQLARLKSQASRWSLERLISFYDSLFRIEALAKSGQSYYSILKALNILIIYSL